MNKKLNGRLERLEKRIQHHHSSITNEIMRVTFATLSTEDLETIDAFLDRGVSMADCTPEEAIALERFNAAQEAAAVSINRRPSLVSE